VFSTEDSIVAIATPPGRGGIGIVRISGPSAHAIAAALLKHPTPLRARHATFTRVVAQDGGEAAYDEVVATFFPSPHSYTGDDVVEISAHGSPVVLNAIVTSAIAAGARLAAPGEFTLRAFLNGKRDLVQAEAVADLIDAATPLQARVAFDQLEGTLTRRIGDIDGRLFDLLARLEASLDFPDEGYHFVGPGAAAKEIETVVAELDDLLASARRGRLIREGATVVVVGRPNVGKSSIFNRLVGTERAIVTEIPGTTRDLVTERIDVGGLAITLVDTAGARETRDVVEREGVMRAARARDVADLLLVVLDSTEPLTSEDEQLLRDTEGQRRLVVANKIDLGKPDKARPTDTDEAPYAGQALSNRSEAANVGRALSGSPHVDIAVSAISGHGFDQLRCAMQSALFGRESLRDTPSITNIRHIALLESARASLDAARVAAGDAQAPEEFVLADLQAARAKFDEIVGTRTSEDVLQHIFERFCIGK
jgi:tRNA modification GTPase